MTLSTQEDRILPPRAQWLWAALLLTTGWTLSPLFACVTPFAALATAAALTLPRATSLGLIGAVWLGNQAFGYAALDYPWTAESAGWGLAIGLAALASVEAARFAAGRANGVTAMIAALLASFAVFEAVLGLIGLAVGAVETFTVAIAAGILGVNTATLAGLMVVRAIGLATAGERGLALRAR